MKTGDIFNIVSQFINIIIFIYFAIIIIKTNSLDLTGLAISAFGLLTSFFASIVSALESR